MIHSNVVFHCMRMCNVLVLPLILAGVSLQTEVNGSGDKSSVDKSSSARSTIHSNQEITGDARPSPVQSVLTLVGRTTEKSTAAKKPTEAPRKQQQFFKNTSSKNPPTAPNSPQIPPRQQVGSSLAKDLGNKPSSGTRTSPARQQPETSTKNPPVVKTAPVPKIDENENKQVSQRAAETKTLTIKSLMTSTLKTKKSTSPPIIARTTSTSTSRRTTVAVTEKKTSPTIATTRKITRHTQKLILKTSLGKKTQKKKHKKTTTAKMDISKTGPKETTKEIAPVVTSLGKKTQKKKHKKTTTAKLDISKTGPKETTKEIAPVITDWNLKTTKKERTFARSKLLSRPTFRSTKKRRTLFTYKSTSTVATVPPLTQMRLTTNVSATPMLTTTGEKETTHEEFGDPIFHLKSPKDEHRAQQTNKSALPFILGVIAGALVVAAVLVLVVLIMVLHHRKRKERRTQAGGLMAEQRPKARKMPRKIESANINATKFSHAGPLVLDAKLKGPVRHALEDNTTGAALSKVQFDPKLNEIVDIGTDVDVIKDASRMTTVATTDTGHAVKKTNQSARSTIPETAKISDRLYTDYKKKPQNEKATKAAAPSP